MKFEEILPLMRNGAKATTIKGQINDGDYWICGYQTILEDMSTKQPCIHRMNKDGAAHATSFDWGIPRWMVMSDDWEIINEETE